MAKFTKTYEVHLGDKVNFIGPDGKILYGTIQNITEFPDIFVETGDPHLEWPAYNHYRIGIDSITKNYNNDSWQQDEYEFDKNEPSEFIYEDDLKTRKIISTF